MLAFLAVIGAGVIDHFFTDIDYAAASFPCFFVEVLANSLPCSRDDCAWIRCWWLVVVVGGRLVGKFAKFFLFSVISKCPIKQIAHCGRWAFHSKQLLCCFPCPVGNLYVMFP